MYMKIQENCAALAENYAALAAGNKMEHTELLLACAGMYLAVGRTPDVERLKECKKLLKQKKGIFSNFRGTAELLVRCKMALAPDPDRYFDDLEAVYDSLKGFFSGDQTVLAAMILADVAGSGRADALVEMTKSLYKEMKQAHPWLTSESDLPFAALMAATGKDASAVYTEAEEIYGLLKGELRADKDTLQMLSHVLAIRSGSAEAKCGKVCDLAKGLKKARHSLGTGSRLAILGVLADAGLPAEELVEQICAADDCLKQYKPFRGFFGVGPDNRRMFAVQMVQASIADRDGLGLSAMMAASVELAIIAMIYMLIITTSIMATSAQSSH